jgi:hypothetical protein
LIKEDKDRIFPDIWDLILEGIPDPFRARDRVEIIPDINGIPMLKG